MAGGAGTSASRRRQRRLRSWLRHERQTVAMELAAALHHSRNARSNAVHEALRRQKTASSGTRPDGCPGTSALVDALKNDELKKKKEEEEEERRRVEQVRCRSRRSGSRTSIPSLALFGLESPWHVALRRGRGKRRGGRGKYRNPLPSSPLAAQFLDKVVGILVVVQRLKWFWPRSSSTTAASSWLVLLVARQNVLCSFRLSTGSRSSASFFCMDQKDSYAVSRSTLATAVARARLVLLVTMLLAL